MDQELLDLVNNKEKSCYTELDKRKINAIKELFKRDDCFFQIDHKSALGILTFLGLDVETAKRKYFELISIGNYQKIHKGERRIIE